MFAPGYLSGCRNASGRALRHGPFIFGEHQTKDMNVVTDVWRRKLIKLWSLCGPWKEKPTQHRFRHTFGEFSVKVRGAVLARHEGVISCPCRLA